MSDIPNGEKKTCLNCHADTKASSQTDFGSDAQTFLTGSGAVSGKHVNWTPLCPLDSDGDGWTNGRELGDPDCTWKAGDPSPSGTVFNPGDPESHPPPVCGNGKLDAGELCEGDMMSTTECTDVGAGEGQLGCTSDCGFDYSGCSMPGGGSSSSGGGGDEPAAEQGCSVAGPGANREGTAALWLLLGLSIAAGARLRRSYL